jgi:4-hydroxybenzoate polyprenyltransferase
MNGLKKYLRETWWVFGVAALGDLFLAYTLHPYCLLFLPALVLVALYMSAVRYDSEGNERQR